MPCRVWEKEVFLLCRSKGSGEVFRHSYAQATKRREQAVRTASCARARPGNS